MERSGSPLSLVDDAGEQKENITTDKEAISYSYSVSLGSKGTGEDINSDKGTTYKVAFKQSSDLSVHIVPDQAAGTSGNKVDDNVDKNEAHYCSQCLKIFSLANDYREHLRTHSDLTTHRCTNCGGIFSNAKDRTEHSKIHDIKCAKCGKEFSHKGNLMKHLRTHEKSQIFNCKHCHLSCSSEDVLKKHLQKHARGKEDSSKRGEKTSLKSQLRKKSESPKRESKRVMGRVKSVQPKSVSRMDDNSRKGVVKVKAKSKESRSPHKSALRVRKYVKESLKKKVDLRPEGRLKNNRNEKSKTKVQGKEKSFVCTKCKRRFVKKEFLDKHILLYHSYSCTKCKKTCTFLTDFKAHQHPNIFMCDECEKEFESESTLTRHKRNHAKASKCFVCSECQMVFGMWIELIRHAQVHQESYECETCKEVLTSKIQLRQHRTEFHGIKGRLRIKSKHCRVCKRELFDVGLLEHRKTRETKGYKCDRCEDALDSCASLEEHRTTMHKDTMVYPCSAPKCGETFTSKLECQKHRLEKHLSTKCEDCGKVFRLQSALRSHQKGRTCKKCKEAFCCLVRFTQHRCENETSCEHCGKAFKGNDKLERHKLSKACKICKKIFPCRGELKKHEKAAHLDLETNPFKCDHCKKAFLNEKVFRQHLDIVCKICQEMFLCKSGFNDHLHSVHANLDVFKCADCDEVFKTYFHLCCHSTKHHGSTYTCYKCDIKFAKSIELRKHQYRSHKECKCNYCGNMFSNRTVLSKHLGTHRDEPTCETCKETFPSRNDLRLHRMRSHQEERVHKCSICNTAFRLKGHLTQHQKLHSSDKPHSCWKCGKTFKFKAYLVKHSKLFHVIINERHGDVEDQSESQGIVQGPEDQEAQEMVTKCSICEKLFQTLREYKLHRHVNNDQSSPFKCCLCEESSITSDALVDHQKDYHTGKQSLTCNEFGKDFIKPSALSRQLHGNTMPSENLFRCPHCKKEFEVQEMLALHVKIHLGASDQSFSCTECNKVFRIKASFEKHLRVHTKEKPYACLTCGTRFSDVSSRSRHTRVHSDKKPYKCTQCEKEFKFLHSLTIHIRTHTKEKPYVCALCNKAFAHSSSYAVHRRTHTGESPFKCSHCPQAFKASNELRRHQKAHSSNAEGFECPVCEKVFNTKLFLLKHKQTCGTENTLTKGSTKVSKKIATNTDTSSDESKTEDSAGTVYYDSENNSADNNDSKYSSKGNPSIESSGNALQHFKDHDDDQGVDVWSSFGKSSVSESRPGKSYLGERNSDAIRGGARRIAESSSSKSISEDKAVNNLKQSNSKGRNIPPKGIAAIEGQNQGDGEVTDLEENNTERRHDSAVGITPNTSERNKRLETSGGLRILDTKFSKSVWNRVRRKGCTVPGKTMESRRDEGFMDGNAFDFVPNLRNEMESQGQYIMSMLGSID